MNQTEEKGLVKKQQTIIACIKKKKSHKKNQFRQIKFIPEIHQILRHVP